MATKKIGLTIAEIVTKKGVSDSKARRALKGVKPAGTVDGYLGRQVAAYSKEQVEAAFPKPAKKTAKAKA